MIKVVNTKEEEIINISKEEYNILLCRFPDFNYFLNDDGTTLQLSTLSLTNNIHDNILILKTFMNEKIKLDIEHFVLKKEILHFMKFYIPRLTEDDKLNILFLKNPQYITEYDKEKDEISKCFDDNILTCKDKLLRCYNMVLFDIVKKNSVRSASNDKILRICAEENAFLCSNDNVCYYIAGKDRKIIGQRQLSKRYKSYVLRDIGYGNIIFAGYDECKRCNKTNLCECPDTSMEKTIININMTWMRKYSSEYPIYKKTIGNNDYIVKFDTHLDRMTVNIGDANISISGIRYNYHIGDTLNFVDMYYGSEVFHTVNISKVLEEMFEYKNYNIILENIKYM
ncbi:Hypothetical protein ORPV_206 [Orpheovirus IHUMI-LCC2]|uniref:Uncharacterized protein n=1 Tax=Orpheovirus IHUMI-LCC2 TaxID=2023057 RepID=A0A2I2L3L3_9VIRU|nr:Hypothetical protein ORPV_206 [Orpheovirus IHUMI-LCC2]SNW62110.1 Hypothetical protein ORPV_206 [Orpheovirus IHUMI-LCC2]